MLHRILPALLVAAAALLATGPAVDGTFLYDDHYYVLQNPAVTGDAPVLSSPLGISVQSLWRPVTVATFRAQYEPGGPARPFLLVNVLLHALTSVLVLVLARCLGLARWPAWAAAVLFAVHPVHAEAVAWVTGRAEVLAALGVVLAWLAYLSPGRLGGGLAAVLAALAALAKENALVAPGLVLAGDLLLGRRPAWGRLALLSVASLSVFATRAAVLDDVVPADGPFLDTPLGGRVIVALNVLGRAFQLLVWPHPLRIDYHRDELSLAQSGTWATLAVLIPIVALAWRRHRVVAAGLTLVPVALATVLHLVPIGEPFAERFLYLPSLPFCLAAGSLLATWCTAEARRPRGLGVALLVTSLILGAGLLTSRSAVGVFRDDLSLWSHAARVAPDLPIPHYTLGRELDERGLAVARDRTLPGSRDALARSLELEPRHAYAGFAHLMLGTLDLGGSGNETPNPRAAATHFRAAIELLPTVAQPRLQLAALATSVPGSVPTAEAVTALTPLLEAAEIDEEQRAAAATLMTQLLGLGSSTDETNGTSSPDGS